MHLDPHVEDFALVIDSAPKVHPPAADPHHHFVRAPARALGPHRERRRVLGEQPNFSIQLADGLIADLDPALREQLFNVPEA